jgi:hypothetical protein
MTELRQIFIKDGCGTDQLACVESNGGLAVNIQDQTSETIDAYFVRELSSFTLAADTPMSTTTTLEYDFTATGGHGISIGNELILLDIVSDRSLQAVATNVVGDVITLDRPIDHVYPSATSLARITSSDMAVDGSVTPVIFTVRAGVDPIDGVRTFLTGLSTSSMDYTRFMGRDPLPNGLVFRIVNGFQKTIFNFKTNREIAQFCYDVNLEGKAPAGQFGLAVRITFGGQDKHGVVLRVSGDSVIQWIVQDDLTSAEDITALQASLEGHKVTD